MTKLGNTTTKLQSTRLSIDPQMACNNSYNLPSAHPKGLEIELVLPNLIQSNLLCAGSSVRTTTYWRNYILICISRQKINPNLFILQYGSGSCSGDSGGPLVFNDKLSTPFRYRQIGIVQGGAGPCGNDIFPGIYARLDDYDVLSFVYKTAFGKNIDSPKPSGKYVLNWMQLFRPK